MDIGGYIEEKDWLAIDEISPYKMIRGSHKCKLDEETMTYQSNHLQVISKDVILVFDCNNREDKP